MSINPILPPRPTHENISDKSDVSITDQLSELRINADPREKSKREIVEKAILAIKQAKGEVLETIILNLMSQKNIDTILLPATQFYKEKKSKSNNAKRKKISPKVLRDMEEKEVASIIYRFYQDYQKDKGELLGKFEKAISVSLIEPIQIDRPNTLEQFDDVAKTIKLKFSGYGNQLKLVGLIEYLIWVNIGYSVDELLKVYFEKKDTWFKGKSEDIFMFETFGEQWSSKTLHNRKNDYRLVLELPAVVFLFINLSISYFPPSQLSEVAVKMRKYYSQNEGIKLNNKEAIEAVPGYIWKALPKGITEMHNFNV